MHRFFSGWHIPADIFTNPNLATAGYQHGVPIGGILNARTEPDVLPRFVVSASANPGTTSTPGHPLQPIKIIKGLVGRDGPFHQTIIDLAGNTDNGATVDPLSCESEGDGFATWCGVWEKTEFDPKQDAVYHARAV